MDDRAELIERLKNLTGRNHKIDAELALIADDFRVRERDNGMWAIFDAPFEPGKWAAASGPGSRADAIETLSTFISLKPYTASVDAAVALVEKIAPDQLVTIVGEAFEMCLSQPTITAKDFPRFALIALLRSDKEAG